MKPERARGRGRGRGRGGRATAVQDAPKKKNTTDTDGDWYRDTWGVEDYEEWLAEEYEKEQKQKESRSSSSKKRKKKTPPAEETSKKKKKKPQENEDAQETKEKQVTAKKKVAKEKEAVATGAEVPKGKKRKNADETPSPTVKSDPKMVKRLKKYIDMFRGKTWVYEKMSQARKDSMLVHLQTGLAHHCRLNKYWRNPACGCTSKFVSHDLAHFYFTASENDLNYATRLAMSLKCADMFVSRMHLLFDSKLDALNNFENETLFVGTCLLFISHTSIGFMLRDSFLFGLIVIIHPRPGVAFPSCMRSWGDQ